MSNKKPTYAYAVITSYCKGLSESAGMYIEYDTHTIEYPNGVSREFDCVTIGEENSDFFVVYTYDQNGDLFLAMKPDYLEDMPYHLPVTAMLTAVMRYCINVCKAS